MWNGWALEWKDCKRPCARAMHWPLARPPASLSQVIVVKGCLGVLPLWVLRLFGLGI